MSEIYSRPDRAISLATDQLQDAALAVADAHSVTVRVIRHPQKEMNRVDIQVSITPSLLTPYSSQVLRRTYEWLRHAYQLPSGLPGTKFLYQDEPHEFLGATLRPPKPDAFFVIARIRDGQCLWCLASFVKKRVVTALAEPSVGIFSVGLGDEETFFDQQ